MTNILTSPLVLVVVYHVLCILPYGKAIRCYQCSSSPEGEDNCGAYKEFDTSRHIPVECNSDESVTPGSFCMKVTQQGPKGFIWDGRWRQVIRRCGAVAETGVTGVCNWGVYKNGVWWEECFCSEDGCNSASGISFGILVFITAVILALQYSLLF